MRIMLTMQHTLAFILCFGCIASVANADPSTGTPAGRSEESSDSVDGRSGRPLSFQRDIGAVLTRYGCNAA